MNQFRHYFIKKFMDNTPLEENELSNIANLKQKLIFFVLDWLYKNTDPKANLHSDSKKIKRGDVFLAFSLDGADNRSYIGDAVNRGASAIIWQPESLFVQKNLSKDYLEQEFVFPPNFCVPNLPVAGLGLLVGLICNKWYGEPSDKMLIIGVTGTNGKTTTSYWTANALELLGQSCGIIGTLGAGRLKQLSYTGFTTPDAAQLQSTLKDFNYQKLEAVAMEVSSHALMQRRVRGVSFDIGVFTNFSQDHLDYHENLENYRCAKESFFRSPSLRVLIINCDDELGMKLIRDYIGKKKIIAYTKLACTRELSELSRNVKDFHLLQARQIKFDVHGVRFLLQDGLDGQVSLIKASCFGLYNVENLLAVSAVCLSLGVHLNQLALILSHLPQVPGRMQFVEAGESGSNPIVIIDYAHTPDALRKILKALTSIKSRRSGRIIIIFGCGGNRDSLKRPIMGAIAAELADVLVLTNDNPRDEDPQSIFDDICQGISESSKNRVSIVEDRGRAITETIQNYAEDEDIILLAGKGHESTQIIAGEEYFFSDQDCARRALCHRSCIKKAFKYGEE